MCSQVACSNTPFSAKAWNQCLGLKEGKVSYIVDSGVDERFTSSVLSGGQLSQVHLCLFISTWSRLTL